MSDFLHISKNFDDKLYSIINTAVNDALDYRDSIRPKPIKLYSSKQVMEMLGISESSLRRYIKSGAIKAKKVNGRIRVEESEVQDILKDVKSLKYKRN